MDDKREQLLEFIYDFWSIEPDRRYPEIAINHDCGISGDDAEELIFECGELLGIPYEIIERFPFDTYFDPEVGPIWEQMLGGYYF